MKKNIAAIIALATNTPAPVSTPANDSVNHEISPITTLFILI